MDNENAIDKRDGLWASREQRVQAPRKMFNGLDRTRNKIELNLTHQIRAIAFTKFCSKSKFGIKPTGNSIYSTNVR